MKTAKSICTTLLEEKYIACCNLFPGVESLYRSSDKIKSNNEVVGILKTRADLYYDIMMRIVELHEYKEPCIIQIAHSCKVNPEYSNWLTHNL